jgi:LPS export ABC transporter protein LptC
MRFAVVLTFAALLAMAACRQEEELPPAPKDLPTQVIDDFTLTETEGEHISWMLKAARADIYDYANEARISGVHVDFYEEGVYSSTLTSREGTVDLLRHNMKASGDVVLVSRKDGAILRTEELNWDADGTRVYSDEYCTLERGHSVIRGQGFTATPGLESFSTHQLDADLLDKEMRDMETTRRDRPGGETGAAPGTAGKPK